MKDDIKIFITLCVFLLILVAINICNINLKSNENSNYKIEYVEDKDGRWELYIYLKNGQKISEAPISEKGDSVLVSPDIID